MDSTHLCVLSPQAAGWSLDLTNMAAISYVVRHVRLVLPGPTDICASLPVMPPFRQRLLPRQHASEYPWAALLRHFYHPIAHLGAYFGLNVYVKR